MTGAGQVIGDSPATRLFVISSNEGESKEKEGYFAQVERRVTHKPTLNTYDPTGRVCIDIVSQMDSWEQETSGFYEMRNVTRAPVAYLQHKDVSLAHKVFTFTFKTMATGIMEAGFHAVMAIGTAAIALPFMAIAAIFSKEASEIFKDLPNRLVFHIKEVVRGLIQAVPIIGPFAAKAYDIALTVLGDGLAKAEYMPYCGDGLIPPEQAPEEKRVDISAKRPKSKEPSSNMKEQRLLTIDEIAVRQRFRRILSEGLREGLRKGDLDFLKEQFFKDYFQGVPPSEAAELKDILSTHPDIVRRGDLLYFPEKS